MVLSHEVSASIIKVAGDWAIAISDKEYQVTSNPEVLYYLPTLKENFEKAYKALKDIIKD